MASQFRLMTRYFGITRLQRKAREWLKKPVITSLQFAQLSKPLQREVKFWAMKNEWRFSINQDAMFNPERKNIGHLFLEVLDPKTGITNWRKAKAGEDMGNKNIVNALVRT